MLVKSFIDDNTTYTDANKWLGESPRVRSLFMIHVRLLAFYRLS